MQESLLEQQPQPEPEGGASGRENPLARTPGMDALQAGMDALDESTEASEALMPGEPSSSGGNEPPRLSRDEEMLSTATKMYRLGFCCLYAPPAPASRRLALLHSGRAR